MTRVSIVTPSFNQAQFLEQTIKSVLVQDYPNIEYFIVDGGSLDGSVDILKKYADKLTWWISEKDTGQADAINKGMSRMNGEIIAWLNSDDYYLPGAVRSAVDTFARHPEAVLIYGDVQAVDANGNTINLIRYDQLSIEDLLCFEIIGQSSVFMRSYALEKAGKLDPALHFLLDHQLWIRIARLGSLLHVPEIWSAARYHPAAKNRARAVDFGREAFKVLEWAREDPNLAPIYDKVARRAMASAYRFNARYYLDGGRAWSSIQAWFRSFWIHPATGLARLNILFSAFLELVGLSVIRRAILRLRQDRLSARGVT
jgi:glycosyltransferase involved in cell wall biosynthesis